MLTQNVEIESSVMPKNSTGNLEFLKIISEAFMLLEKKFPGKFFSNSILKKLDTQKKMELLRIQNSIKITNGSIQNSLE